MKIKKLKNFAKFILLILILSFFFVPLLQADPPTFQGISSIAASTGGNVTVTLPTGYQPDDIFLLSVMVRDQNDTITVAGWTQIATVDRGSISRYWWFWRRAASSSETNPVVSKSTANGDTYAAVISYRGAISTGDPWEVVGTPQTGTSDPFVLTGITTLSEDSLIVAAVAGEDNNNNSIITTGTNPAAYTEHYLESGTGSDGVITFSEAAKTTIGATGNVSVNWNSAVPVGEGGILLALKPLPIMSTIYAINNSNIYRINSANSVSTLVYSGIPLGNAAALAQCPDGMLYFSRRTSPYQLYRFNPNTPSVAPAVVGNTGIDMIRMTCHPTTGVLYGMPSLVGNLYILNTTTGAATAIPLTLPSDTPPAAGSGDIGFDAEGTLYFAGETTSGSAATVRLWTINLITNSFENVGAVTGLPAVANGIAFDDNGNVLLSLTGETRLYTVSTDGGAATAVGASTAMSEAVTDLSSVNIVKLLKSDVNTIVSLGDTLTYNVDITSAAKIYGLVFTDPAVANLTVANVTCTVMGGGAACPAVVTVAAMQGAGINIPAMPSGGSLRFTITGVVTGSPEGVLTNTANISFRGQTNSASDININATKRMKIIKWREIAQ